MVYKDDLPASMLLLPAFDPVAFWLNRLSGIGPVTPDPSVLFVSEESKSVHADAVSWTYEAKAIA
jgi:hypothetical protein